ncbi:MAG: cytochrome b, partial [Pseudomonadota bacterium]|nr:cytochrome b [Pseudomonadota bacterium]
VYLILSQLGTAYYFFHFLILLPILGKIETPLPLPTSLSEPVIGGGGGAALGATAAKREKK